MRRIWRIRAVDEVFVHRLAQSLEIPPLVARLLAHRRVNSPEEALGFLCADLSTLAPPERMADLEKAVHRIRLALLRAEPILLVGDYDVDGLTGTALLYRVLRELGAQVSWHIPHRMTDGYGLKSQVVREASDCGVKLLITIDCGTTHFEELRLAHQLGMETIVVDHHELLPAGRPPALALLNPLQSDCRYPCKDLASVGVAFTLARGLWGEREPKAWAHLDLVALGTVADWAPLVGENRILVKAGLHRLRSTDKKGLRALLSAASLSQETLSGEEISFSLAPRLNAAGRTGSAEASLRLLITEDLKEAQALAKELNRENKNRRVLEREALGRALAKVEREVNFRTDRVIVLEDERWHPGVIGIVAARLAMRFHRPTVVIALNGTDSRGSARSIPNFHLVEALEATKEHLVAFGGHPAAAGLTIRQDQVEPFRQALNQVAHDRIDPKALTPHLELDAELPLSFLTEELMRDLEVLAPFGSGNPWPIFMSKEVRFKAADKSTAFSPRGIRRIVQDSGGQTFEAIQPLYDGWQEAGIGRLKGQPVALAYSPIRRIDSTGRPIELKIRGIMVSDTKMA